VPVSIVVRHYCDSQPRHIPTNAVVAIFDAAKKLDTGQEYVRVLSPQSSGRFVGSITVNHAVNTNGADLKHGALHDSTVTIVSIKRATFPPAFANVVAGRVAILQPDRRER